MKYDRRNTTSLQALMEQLLVTLAHNGREVTFDEVGAAEQGWAAVSLEAIKDAQAGLTEAGLVAEIGGKYELTGKGRNEARVIKPGIDGVAKQAPHETEPDRRWWNPRG